MLVRCASHADQRSGRRLREMPVTRVRGLCDAIWTRTYYRLVLYNNNDIYIIQLGAIITRKLLPTPTNVVDTSDRYLAREQQRDRLHHINAGRRPRAISHSSGYLPWLAYL